MVNWNIETCGQKVLPAGHVILIAQKLAENAKIEKFKWDIFGWFSNTVSSHKSAFVREIVDF